MTTTAIRRSLLAALCVGLVAASAPAFPAEQTPLPPINTLGGGGVAIYGYDPVAYFVDGGPRLGRADLALAHRGATWRFASEANRDRFRADPDRYVPVYGGYCAYGVSRNYLVKIDPEAWSIVDGRLYLNYDKPVQKTWLTDTSGYIAKANGNWPSLVSPARPQ